MPRRRETTDTIMSGQQLAALREVWGLTQVQLAQLLDYDPKTISEMENGRKGVPNMAARYLLVRAKLLAIKKLVNDP